LEQTKERILKVEKDVALIGEKLKELGDELGTRIGSQKGNGGIDYSAKSVNNSTLQEISDDQHNA